MSTDPTPHVIQQLVQDLRADLKVADEALARVRETAVSGGGAVREELGATLRQLRADAGHLLSELDASTSGHRAAYLSEARRRLDASRGALDEMWVRTSLGRKEVQDDTTRLLGAAENAWLAARARLTQAQSEAQDTLDDTRTGLNEALRRFNAALSDARAAFNRSREA
ncbi:hypothetical protein [Nocardioides pacificus]